MATDEKQAMLMNLCEKTYSKLEYFSSGVTIGAGINIQAVLFDKVHALTGKKIYNLDKLMKISWAFFWTAPFGGQNGTVGVEVLQQSEWEIYMDNADGTKVD